MKNKNETKRIVTVAILISLSVIFSYFDNLISHALFQTFRLIMPSFKIGLANIAIIIFIMRFSVKDGLFAIILKSLLVALMFTGVTGFMIGFPGTLLSFIVMTIFNKMFKSDKYIIFISAAGGLSHSLGQLLTAFAIYGINQTETFLIYSPMILLVGLIAGCLVGVVGQKVVQLLDSYRIITKNND